MICAKCLPDARVNFAQIWREVEGGAGRCAQGLPHAGHVADGILRASVGSPGNRAAYGWAAEVGWFNSFSRGSWWRMNPRGMMWGVAIGAPFLWNAKWTGESLSPGLVPFGFWSCPMSRMDPCRGLRPGFSRAARPICGFRSRERWTALGPSSSPPFLSFSNKFSTY